MMFCKSSKVRVTARGEFYGKVGSVVDMTPWHGYEVAIEGVGIRLFAENEIKPVGAEEELESAAEKMVAKYHVGEDVWIGGLGNPYGKVGKVVDVIRRRFSDVEDFIYGILVSGVDYKGFREDELMSVGHDFRINNLKVALGFKAKQDYHFKVTNLSEVDLPRIVREAEAGVDAILVAPSESEDAWLLLDAKLAKKMDYFVSDSLKGTTWRSIPLFKRSIQFALKTLHTARAEKPVETKKIIVNVKAV